MWVAAGIGTHSFCKVSMHIGLGIGNRALPSHVMHPQPPLESTCQHHCRYLTISLSRFIHIATVPSPSPPSLFSFITNGSLPFLK
jgi:hypothetical protein